MTELEKQLIKQNTELKEMLIFIEHQTGNFDSLCTCGNDSGIHSDHCITREIRKKVEFFEKFL